MGEARFTVELTEPAWADLDELDTYWTMRGEAWRGQKYYHDLRRTAQTELTNPLRARHGRRLKSNEHPEAREILAFGIYRIIYEIDEDASRVRILRFWHAHRDEPRREA
ncbi:MAG TPA: type II toxin-antitoxin system RelE/ParE family toxin [Chthoniobacteraceae bacterium]|nr:type II toxin-antitoxin system RelE/ParE family toxin [Chthoniobacteraceae bacterium]